MQKLTFVPKDSQVFSDRANIYHRYCSFSAFKKTYRYNQKQVVVYMGVNTTLIKKLRNVEDTYYFLPLYAYKNIYINVGFKNSNNV